MSEVGRWFVRGVYAIDHVVRLVPADRWHQPSPCEGWTARHVLGHVVAVQAYFTAVIDHRVPTMDPMTDPDRHVGADPVADWSLARDAVLEAIDRPGVLDSVVTTFGVEQRVEALIEMNALENAVHSWDLARATGVDERLDHGLVRHSLALVKRLDATGRDPRHHGVRLDAPSGDDQAVLLAALGRRA